jgi:DNA-directed RNA polymerase specialized sigma24 family protein
LDPEAPEVAQPRYGRPGAYLEAAAGVDDRALLEAALLRLPPKLRQVVVLRDVYDLSHKAIAAELGTSEAAAKMGIQRARRRLREDLSSQMGETANNRRSALRRRPKRSDGTVVALAPVVPSDGSVDGQAHAVAG